MTNTASISPTTVMVAGGFAQITDVKSSDPEMDTTPASTGQPRGGGHTIVLHCVNTNADRVVVLVCDIDMLSLLAAHFDKMPSTPLWMKTGNPLK